MQVGRTLTVGGWVKTGRMAEKNTLLFLELNDGSTPKNLQVCTLQTAASMRLRCAGCSRGEETAGRCKEGSNERALKD